MSRTKRASRVRPPNRPKRESPAVTIGNLELQVRNLTNRVAQVVQERDAARRDATEACTERNRLAPIQEAYTRLQGWQDCAREVLNLDRAEISINRPMIAPGV